MPDAFTNTKRGLNQLAVALKHCWTLPSMQLGRSSEARPSGLRRAWSPTGTAARRAAGLTVVSAHVEPADCYWTQEMEEDHAYEYENMQDVYYDACADDTSSYTSIDDESRDDKLFASIKIRSIHVILKKFPPQ